MNHVDPCFCRSLFCVPPRSLQRKIAAVAGADGVIDVWTALNGTNISTHATMDGIHPYPPALGVIAHTIAKAIAPTAVTEVGK